jgi:hypothetical protein
MERRNESGEQEPYPVRYSGGVHPRSEVASTAEPSLSGSQTENSHSPDEDKMLERMIGPGFRVIRCQAKVVHVTRSANGKIQAGIEFEGMTEADRHILEQHLAKKNT